MEIFGSQAKVPALDTGRNRRALERIKDLLVMMKDELQGEHLQWGYLLGAQ